MIENGTLIWPNYNKNACELFDKLERDLDLNGFYATKNKEKRIGRFWIDYYEPNKNIVIEYDEPYHFDTTGNLRTSDVQRQQWIINRLGCRFYRLNEQTKYEQFRNILSRDLL